MNIPCQCCHKTFPPTWTWFICGVCGFRICPSCLNKHEGQFSKGGFKCSQCQMGVMEQKSSA